VPLNVIDQVVDKIRDNSITKLSYGPASASLVEVAEQASPKRKRR
jgi:hypothetical protein